MQSSPVLIFSQLHFLAVRIVELLTVPVTGLIVMSLSLISKRTFPHTI